MCSSFCNFALLLLSIPFLSSWLPIPFLYPNNNAIFSLSLPVFFKTLLLLFFAIICVRLFCYFVAILAMFIELFFSTEIYFYYCLLTTATTTNKKPQILFLLLLSVDIFCKTTLVSFFLSFSLGILANLIVQYMPLKLYVFGKRGASYSLKID